MHRRTFAGWLAALGTLATSLPAALLAPTAQAAENFPSRPLRISLHIGPGSSGDGVARYVADKLGAALGQSVVVENRPGAEGLISVQNVLSAPADGYSVLLISPTMVTGPMMNKAAQYDLQRDFRVLSFLYRSPAMLATGAASPWKTAGEWLSQVRGKPGSVSLADYGNSYRVGAIVLTQQAQLQVNPVSYKTSSQMNTDLIGGAVDTAMTDTGSTLPLVRAGKVRALAVASKTRLAELPDVPTLREAGVPDYDLYVWVGLAVRRQTPEPVVRRLQQELTKIVGAPAFDTFSGAEPMPVAGDDAAREIARETARFRKAVDASQR